MVDTPLSLVRSPISLAAGEKKSFEIFAHMLFLVFLSRLGSFTVASSQGRSGKIIKMQLPLFQVEWGSPSIASSTLQFPDYY